VGYLVLALRLAIGGLLTVAGAIKAHDGPNAFAAAVTAYRLLPAEVVRPLALVLPYLEIGIGVYLLLGLLTRVVAVVATVQFVVFAGAIASLVVRGISADCGCFGSGHPEPATWGRVVLDLAFACAAACIARRSPGAFALDARLADGPSGAEREA